MVYGSGLFPAAFDPDVSIVTMLPAAIHPDCVRVRRGDVFARDPDVGVAVPAVVPVAPGPVAMLDWRFGASFDDAGRRSNADDNLRACHERCGKYETANGGE